MKFSFHFLAWFTDGVVVDFPGGPPPHHNHLDDRTARQKHRLQDKLQRRKDSHYYHAHPPGSQSRSKNKSGTQCVTGDYGATSY